MHEPSKFPEFCKAKGIQVYKTLGPFPGTKEWPASDGWKVHLRYQDRNIVVSFHQGFGYRKAPAGGGDTVPTPPKVADVLSCLLSDARAKGQTFEEWARDCGCDTDSRKAEKTFQACLRSATKLHHLLGADFDAFRDAESDY